MPFFEMLNQRGFIDWRDVVMLLAAAVVFLALLSMVAGCVTIVCPMSGKPSECRSFP